jgi:hypothetical protein
MLFTQQHDHLAKNRECHRIQREKLSYPSPAFEWLNFEPSRAKPNPTPMLMHRLRDAISNKKYGNQFNNTEFILRQTKT